MYVCVSERERACMRAHACWCVCLCVCVCVYISEVYNLAEISVIRMILLFLNWKIATLKQGCTYFPFISEPFEISRCQKSDTKQIPC
jgi:hypothetical protein